jgi:adenosylhomocysteine nucleosidase
MKRIVIVAAMEREVKNFVAGWQLETIDVSHRAISLYERNDVAVVCGGIGGRAARIASDEAYKILGGEVSLFVSAGVAGALVANLKVGDVIQPLEIIDEADSLTIRASSGKGKLVSSGAVASAPVKDILARRFQADAVDMEAYAVADVAQVHGVPFIAVKAISDELGFKMPPLGRFVSESGTFQTASFVAYVTVRPWLWPSVLRLGANTAKAAQALSRALTDVVSRYSPAQDSSSAQYNS